VESHHDEEVEGSVSEDRSHQPGHPGLAVISFQLEDEDDDANEGNKVYLEVRFSDICETVGSKYQRTQPATCRPTCRPRHQRKYTLGTGREGSLASEQLRGRLEENKNNWTRVLPPAEGTLTSHNPVAEDEVTRIPKRTSTYLLASVRTYTLDQTRLSDNTPRGERNRLTSSSGRCGRVLRRRQNSTPPT